MSAGGRTIHPASGRRRGPRLARRLALAAGLTLAAGACAEHDTKPPTVQTNIGIWYQRGAPTEERLRRAGDQGQALFVRGRVVDTDGRAIPNALVELWHADSEGFTHYRRFRARLATGPDGFFKFETVYPGYICGPRHIHFVINHPGHRKLVTRIFFKRDPVVAEAKVDGVVVVLEDGAVDGEPALFGEVELVLERAEAG